MRYLVAAAMGLVLLGLFATSGLHGLVHLAEVGYDEILHLLARHGVSAHTFVRRVP